MSSLLTLVSLAGLMDLALKSAAVMLLALLAVLLLGRASAAWRHLVWCLSAASLLLLPALSLALPAWRVTWLPRWTEPAKPALAEWTVIPLETTRRLDAPTVFAPSATEAPAAEPLAKLPYSEVESKRLPSASFPWLAIGWAAGGLLALTPLGVGLWQVAALKRRSQAINDERWLVLLEEAQRRLAVRRRVRLHRSASARVPLTWGALYPVLLVPAEADAWTDERRRLVLLHELAHIRRWDWLTQLVVHAACVVYWFNPLVWLAARQMRIERERACDDLVLASGAKASDYAQELLALAAGLTNLRLSALAAVPMARRGSLEDRLRSILDNRRSRAAVTTAAVFLGAAIVAAAAAPLAMLRAAPAETPRPASEQAKPANNQPPAKEPAQSPAKEPAQSPAKEPAQSPAKEPAPEKPPQRDPTPDEIESRANGIRISVLNAKGDRGIPEFRVIAGVNSGGVAEEYEKRTGRTVINWQPHTCRIGKDGDYVWPLAKAYDEMAIRVEADGYQPTIIPGVRKDKGVQHIVCMLNEDEGVTGRVLTPDGLPAAGAIVALAIPHQEIVWEEGKLRYQNDPLPEKPGDRWQRPRFVTADDQGRFRLPTEFEPAAVLVIHDSGLRELAYDDWKAATEVTLQKWGSVAGQILWQDKPGADEEVTFTVHRDEYGYPGMIASYGATRSDQAGKFAFDRMLPGLVQISRPIKPAEPNAAGITAVIVNGMFQHVKVASGAATPVVLGGQGRKVTGKFVGLDSWEGATFQLHPTAPHVGFGGDDAMWKAFGQLQTSAIGPVFFRDKQPVNKDGTFGIDRVLPGSYQLFLTVPGTNGYAASAQVQVEPETPGQKPAELKLGEIAVAKKPPAAPPGAGNAAESAANAAAKTVAIRGKVVDDSTDKPVGKFIIQAGKFDPADPKNVLWGYREETSTAADGSFSTAVEWSGGWTARIRAEGYFPQPLLALAPTAETTEMEVTIRLVRVPEKVRGVVLDHTGKPLKDAAVFAVGPGGVNLISGEARLDAPDQPRNDWVHPVRTDAEGRFELPTKGATLLGVSHARFDAWPAAIPATGEVTIRLPEPAGVDVTLDIEGAEQESVIFYQLLSYNMPGWGGGLVGSTRWAKMANPGKLMLNTLPPGKYQLCRRPGQMVERQFFELKAGEVKSIAFVRQKGARVRGKVTWPADARLMAIVVSVLGESNEPYASTPPGDDGAFLTERIPPGKYQLLAYAFEQQTPERLKNTSPIIPSFQAQVQIEVPAEGELTAPDLALKPIVRRQ